MLHQPIPAQLAYLHWSSGHDFRLSRVKSRQARETGVRFPDGELPLLLLVRGAVPFAGVDCGEVHKSFALEDSGWPLRNFC